MNDDIFIVVVFVLIVSRLCILCSSAASSGGGSGSPTRSAMAHNYRPACNDLHTGGRPPCSNRAASARREDAHRAMVSRAPQRARDAVVIAAQGGGPAIPISVSDLKIKRLDTIMANRIDQIRGTLALIPLLGIRIRPPFTPIRSTTSSETPSSGCTRSPDEISTNGFSSSSWPETIFPAKTAAAACERERGGGVCFRVLEMRVVFTCVTLNGSGIQLAVGPQPLWFRNHNSGPAQRIMVKRLATSPHDPLGITDSACKNQSVVVSVQYGPFNPYIPIRSTSIGKSRVARDPIAMHTSWRSNSDIASVTSIGYPRMSASGESSAAMHRLLHASGSHPIPTPYDSRSKLDQIESELVQISCELKKRTGSDRKRAGSDQLRVEEANFSRS
ncbi:hypothetical protein F511_37575 [Dorcoceras hygrometricum]|uniref:Uncharacterized protein n=1 Tax=Dorcoceras hygrometricum TaxID=472368 RepID=A0A2Z7CIA4_9LAMI|nr:hypothetical protein F511_37575 [Dorcoceras hygrometricum]